MNIKRIAILLLGAVLAIGSMEAKKMSDLKIYINPGHGGYTSNDRPITLYPFAQNDTAGYWESKSNLYKGLHMYYILDSIGAKAYLSRTHNRTEDTDRSLSGIAAEANSLGCDLFFSIHSNAGENVNYPLMLYRENAIGTPRYPENVTLSKILWKNLHSNEMAVWTRDKEYVEGDLTFYQNMWQGGLGVLRTLYVVGLLSEGGMHEHRPEAYRLMNDDYWWLEAWHFVRSIMEFYDTEDRFVTGNVAGVVYDDHNLREKDMPVTFTRHGRDKLAPVNGAFVVLLNEQGDTVQKRTTDNMYNGVFVLRNVKPGKYKLHISHSDYYTEERDVTVTANEVSYNNVGLNMKREFPLQITKYAPNVAADEAVSCASSIDFDFNTDVDEKSFEKAFTISPAVDGYWEYSNTYRHAKFVPTMSLDLNTTYTVSVSTEAKTPDTHFGTPNLSAPLQFSFTTKGRNRLEIIDQFPKDNGTVHYKSPSVEVRFDKAIDATPAYDQVKITDANGNNVAINKRSSKFNQLSNGYGNAVLAVTGNLEVGKQYTLSISKDMRDKEQLPIGSDFTLRFSAIDATSEAAGQNVKLDFEDSAMPFSYDPENTVGVTSANPTAIRSTSVKLLGSAAGRFGYQFADNHGGEIVWNYTGEPIQYNTNDVIGMYVNGDFNNHELWVALSSGTNKKWTKLTDLDFLGWQYREAKLTNLEEDFCPFLLSDIKLVQVGSPITQKGAFGIDNITYKATELDVGDISTDNSGVSVTTARGTITVSGANSNDRVDVVGVNGAVTATAQGDCTIEAAAGLYVVKVGGKAYKVLVR